jgi:Calcineurin-like phosphoesterase/Carbohydrate family 9 binding domain-like
MTCLGLAMRSTTPVALLVLLLSANASEASAASSPDERTTGIVSGPWVNSVTDTSAKVLWVAPPAVEGSCTLLREARDMPADLKQHHTTSAIGGRQEVLHTTTLTGLKPYDLYEYTVACGDSEARGSFVTARPRGSREPFRFLAYSDPQTYPERHRKVAEAARKDGPHAFLAIAGDLAQDSSKWSNLKEHFFDPARELLRGTALWTARGNHEKDGKLYRDVFALPGNELYYSFNFGNLHYVMLDCYQPGSTRHRRGGAMAAMLTWLDADLAAARTWADWTIVSYHDPTFNAGARGSDWGRDTVLPILEKHEVDLVLCGHSHIYERCVPIGPKGKKPIIHITHGGGGGPTYNTTVSPIIATTYAGLHYCLFEIEGNRLRMVAKTPEGKVIDRLSLSKTDGRYPKEITAAALTTEEAGPLVKIFKLLPGTVTQYPRDGQGLAVSIPGDRFPRGSSLTISPSADTAWTFAPLTFEPMGEPVQLTATPPDGVTLAVTPWMGYFDPPLTVRIAFTLRGKTMTHDGVPIMIPADVVRRIVPIPKASTVPEAAGAITVDGSLDDWAGIEPITLPSTGKPSSVLRLAWREGGLYGIATVTDSDVKINVKEPWKADTVAVSLELDNARRFGLRRTTPASKLFLSPNPAGGAGPALIRKQSGRVKTEAVRAVWRKTPQGYQIEFAIAAEALKPARMTGGVALGFHYAVHNNGDVAEEFADLSRFKSRRNVPMFWGRIVLSGPRSR